MGVLVVVIVVALLLPTASTGPMPSKVLTAKNDVVMVANGLKAYRERYGEYPGGTQAEVVEALRGRNARKIVFMEVEGKGLNGAGEMVDPWGVVLRIDTTSAAARETGKARVYSTGKDKVDQGGREGTDDVVSWR